MPPSPPSPPEIILSIRTDSPLWDEHDVKEICTHTLRKTTEDPDIGNIPYLSGGACVSVLLTDDAHIRELNREHREKDRATNVLSFPLFNPGELDIPPPFPHGPEDNELGDIVLAYETVMRECEEAWPPKAFKDHLTHLVLHGFLHLLGYDHTVPEEAVVMEELETRILETLGVENPYKDDDET